MPRCVIGVLALQGDVREHIRMLEESGAKARAVRRPDELLAVDGLVIPGGESTTISKLAVEFGVLAPIRKRIAEGMPAYGSCAGMIMLARKVLDGRDDQQTFGGIDMAVRRNAFGRQVDSFETDVRVEGVSPEPLHAVFIRAPWVESVAPPAQVISRIDGGVADGRIVATRQGNVLATAFHPELTPDLRIHRRFVAIVAEAQAAGADTAGGEPSAVNTADAGAAGIGG